MTEAHRPIVQLRLLHKRIDEKKIDLIICDEGHRLKSTQFTKTNLSIRSLPTRRRVLLTGTPIQNDLGEFFAMVDLVNPGILGSYQAFKKVFEEPILKSRQPSASESEAVLGEERAKEVSVENEKC
jgi:DNA repair and recombination protein RAD54B